MSSSMGLTPLTAAIYLTPPIRRALADLNRTFLHSRIGALEAAIGDLSCSVSASTTVDRRTVDRMASCPFTLFELRTLEPSAIDSDPGHPRGRNPLPLSAFEPNFEDQSLAQATLILASQLAESSRLTLAMAVGPSRVPHAMIRNTPVTRLPQWLKSRHMLRVRWLDHPHFWSTLFGAGRQRDGKALARAHCLGLTLLAGELVQPDFDGSGKRIAGAKPRGNR
jgi:hypothetical protein